MARRSLKSAQPDQFPVARTARRHTRVRRDVGARPHSGNGQIDPHETSHCYFVAALGCTDENNVPSKYIGFVDVAESDAIGQLFQAGSWQYITISTRYLWS